MGVVRHICFWSAVFGLIWFGTSPTSYDNITSSVLSTISSVELWGYNLHGSQDIPQGPISPDVLQELLSNVDTVWNLEDLTTRHELPGTIRCYPSTGGIIVAPHVSAVELDFLGLDRFNGCNRSLNQEDETAFCRKVVQVGGKWWKSDKDRLEAHTGARAMTEEERAVRFFCWPTGGGVWVLKIKQWESVEDESRIQNALSMEERCHAIEMSGGIFYDDPQNYDDIQGCAGSDLFEKDMSRTVTSTMVIIINCIAA